MKKILGTILGIILFFGVIFFFGGVEVINILMKSNLSYFSLALFIQICIIFLYVKRLKIILAAQKYTLEFKKLTMILLSGMAINQMTPVVKAGGEPVKMYYLTKNNIPATKSTATVVVEITSELISFYILLFLSVIYISASEIASSKLLYGGFIFSVLCLIGIWWSFKILSDKNKIEKFIEKYILKFSKVNAKTASKVFSSSIKNLIYNKFLVSKILFLSFLSRFLEFLRIYFILLAINFHPSFHLIITIWTLILLFSSIPWLPGGLGLIEGGTISVLLVVGVPGTISSSMILLDRTITLWFVVILGFTTLYLLKKSVEKAY